MASSGRSSGAPKAPSKTKQGVSKPPVKSGAKANPFGNSPKKRPGD